METRKFHYVDQSFFHPFQFLLRNFMFRLIIGLRNRKIIALQKEQQHF